jgi:hypothetical protein
VHRRRCLPTFNASSHAAGFGAYTRDNYHMLELPPPSPRKRQRPESSPEQTGTSQPPSKKQRLSNSGGSQPPPAFWDNLTKLWLTKRALRELDRRNRQAAASQSPAPYRRAHRPVTRKFIAKQKASVQAADCIDYISRCTPKILKDISVFARHGGPDLSDLRSVCLAKHLLASKLTLIVPRTYTSFRSHNEL